MDRLHSGLETLDSNQVEPSLASETLDCSRE
jgi:hypothetical protein